MKIQEELARSVRTLIISKGNTIQERLADATWDIANVLDRELPEWVTPSIKDDYREIGETLKKAGSEYKEKYYFMGAMNLTTPEALAISEKILDVSTGLLWEWVHQ